MTGRTTLVALALVANAACARDGDGSRPADEGDATLTLLDSVVIREDASSYVARPTHFVASARHGHFITDAFSRNVIQVRADGAIAGSIGRRGRGPGEFEAPSTVLVVRDSLLLVADQARGGVVVRDIAGGGELGLIPVEGNRPTMVMVGDTVYAGTANSSRGTALARWTMAGEPVRYFGALPAGFGRAPHSQFIRNVALAAWRDTLAYVVGLSEVVYIATSDGAVRDSIVVPRSQRRGVPSAVKLASLRDPAAVTAGSSVPWALGALGDGRLVAVFADGEVRANAFGGRLFVTVLARGKATTCTDIPLPSDGNDLPRIAFDGDRMLVLEQRVVDGKALNVIRRYGFSPHCASGAPSASDA